MALKSKAIHAALLSLAAKFAEGDPAPETSPTDAPPDALKEYKTDSGVVLKIDKLEAGGKVYQEDGTTAVTTGATLVDGTVLEIGADGVITLVTTAAPSETPETQMQALAAKFALGTPDDRLANLEMMMKAVMQYCFNWKIEEKLRETIEAQAIEAYKTLDMPAQLHAQMQDAVNKITELGKVRLAAQSKTDSIVSELLKLAIQLAEAPSADPPEKPNGAQLEGESIIEQGTRMVALLEQLK